MNRSELVTSIANKISLPESTVKLILDDLAASGWVQRPIEFTIDELAKKYPAAYEALPNSYKLNPASVKFYIDVTDHLCAENLSTDEFLFWVRGETSFWGQISW